jgi:hypothetical protein
MLVPGGADKCPKCYCEGGLQWLDDERKEAAVSQLDLIPEYVLVTKNDPELTEYLSDAVLKEEFNMEPDPKHKYNPKPVRKPTDQCTLEDLSFILLNLEYNKEFNFSQNSNGSDYWGAKRLNLFNGDIIVFGYYGSCAYETHLPESQSRADLLRKLRYHLERNNNVLVYLFEKPQQEKNIVNEKTKYLIYAVPGHSISSGTLRPQDLLPKFLKVIRETGEYVQISIALPYYPFENDNDTWWDQEGQYVLQEVMAVLEKYAPDGYYFGTREGDGADFGYWEIPEEKPEPDADKIQ